MGATAAKEGTMEDILASIRKIIATDTNLKQSDSKKVVTPSASDNGNETVVSKAENALPLSDANMSNAMPSSPAERSTPPSGSLAGIAASVASDEYEKAATTAKAASVTTNTDIKPSTADAGEDVQKSIPTMKRPATPLKSLAQTVREMGIANNVASKTEEPLIQVAQTVPENDTQFTASPSQQIKVEPPVVQKDEETEAFKEALVSPSTKEAITSSMDRLKKSVADNQEAKVEAVLRPMLREWLDENLPKMVEKLVQEEIDRIAKSDD